MFTTFDMNRKLEMINSFLILAQFYHSEARIPELFLPVTMAIRSSLAFRLHNDDTNCKKVFLKPPTCDLEREQRRRLFWFAYVQDQIYSMRSGVLNNVHEDDIFVELPCTSQEYYTADIYTSIPRNNQHVYDQDFFTNHPKADGFIFMIKSSILLAKVARWRHRSAFEAKRANVQSASSLPSFKELDSLIMDYKASIPIEWSDSVQIVEGGLNVEILLAHYIGARAMTMLRKF